MNQETDWQPLDSGAQGRIRRRGFEQPNNGIPRDLKAPKDATFFLATQLAHLLGLSESEPASPVIYYGNYRIGVVNANGTRKGNQYNALADKHVDRCDIIGNRCFSLTRLMRQLCSHRVYSYLEESSKSTMSGKRSVQNSPRRLIFPLLKAIGYQVRSTP